jgi:translation initiation factor 2 beta subunit (eIF-2beta)/eIF-5
MIGMLTHNFDIEQDEGFIFENRRVGEGEAVFNYRAYLNQESEPKRKAAKENKHVKIFFHCPHCGAEEGKLNKDEDEEIVMICGSCKESVPVF